jgi:hypothetical protein
MSPLQFPFIIAVYIADLLFASGGEFQQFSEGAELHDHFLVMAMTLMRCSCSHFFAHRDVDLEFGSFKIVQLKPISFCSQKIKVSVVFLLSPIIFYLLLSF